MARLICARFILASILLSSMSLFGGSKNVDAYEDLLKERSHLRYQLQELARGITKNKKLGRNYVDGARDTTAAVSLLPLNLIMGAAFSASAPGLVGGFAMLPLLPAFLPLGPIAGGLVGGPVKMFRSLGKSRAKKKQMNATQNALQKVEKNMKKLRRKMRGELQRSPKLGKKLKALEKFYDSAQHLYPV